MNIPETIKFIHIYMSTHMHIHRHMYTHRHTHTHTDIVTRFPICVKDVIAFMKGCL